MQAPKIVLASSSAYRIALLTRWGIDFTAESPDIDESPLPGETPKDLVLRLSRAKAEAVASRHADALVIGSDQVATLESPSHGNSEILGKPGTRERAIAQLTNASGRTLVFLTGLALVDGRNGRCHTHVDETLVTFRSLSRSEIERYVDLDTPLDCAGAIKSESMGSLLFERVETNDPSAGIGLPLIKLGDLLRRAGASPLGQTD